MGEAKENNNNEESPRVNTPPVPPPRRRGRIRKFVLAGGAGLALIVIVILLYQHFVAPYESTDDAFIDGYITLISPRIPGPVVALRVTDDEEVRQGQVLAEIDSRDYSAALSAARADLAVARSQLAQAHAQVSVYEAKVSEAQASVAAADAQARRSREDLARYHAVVARAVSETAMDEVQAQARTTAAALSSARSQVQAAAAAVTLGRAGIDAAAAAVAQAQAKLQLAELNLSYTKILAPVDGRVTARSVQPGNFVQPGQTLLAIVPKNLWVTANFKETQSTYMRPGESVQLRIDAYPDRSFHGHVDSLQAGTGARFSLLPPENAVGNYVKVVQRLPVKIVFDHPLPAGIDVAPGMSVVPTVRVR